MLCLYKTYRQALEYMLGYHCPNNCDTTHVKTLRFLDCENWDFRKALNVCLDLMLSPICSYFAEPTVAKPEVYLPLTICEL